LITQDDILYLIVTDRFADGDPDNNGEVDRSSLTARHGGDLVGIVQRMPYLRDLGVTTLWLTPVYLNPPDAYHGYHPLDFTQVDPHLWSPELGPLKGREPIRRFVAMAHQHGLKVLLDLIVNHTAPDHPWLKERPDWFNPNLPTMEKCWLWDLPDLNHDNLDVNAYFIRNALDWIGETGVDGIRLDAARHVETQFWDLFKLFVQGRHPQCTIVGEVWDPEPARVAPFQAQHGFDSMYDFPLFHAIRDVFVEDRSFTRIAARDYLDPEQPGVLNCDRQYRNAQRLITFIENHDTERFFTAAGGGEDPEIALRRTQLALTFLFTTRGIPQLYYGGELAMEGGEHPDNRRDMPWNLLDGMSDGAATRRAREMRAFLRRLLRLRRDSPGLRFGTVVTLYVTDTVYAFARLFPGDQRLVVFNNGDAAAQVALPIEMNPHIPTIARHELQSEVRIANELPPYDVARLVDGFVPVLVGPRWAALYRVDRRAANRPPD
jgi:glycosidase